MSKPDHNPGLPQVVPAQPRPPAAPPGTPVSPAPDADVAQARLAHELSNLLDASLRNVNLVMHDLREQPGRGPTALAWPAGTAGTAAAAAHAPARAAGDDDVLQRLETANTGLRQMAMLLQRWLKHYPSGALHQDAHTLGQTVQHAVRLLAPAAAHHRIEITVCLADEAARLPAGPVYPVIANALRNSIEALTASPAALLGAGAAGTVEVIGQVDPAGMVELVVRDNGPGIDPALLTEAGRFHFGATTKLDGHGLGLSLSRDIATALGGELHLENRAPRGAVLTLRYPAASVIE